MPTTKAFLVIPGTEIPGRFPWQPNQYVRSVEPVHNDSGAITAIRISTTQGTFQCHPQQPIAFPIRDDGSLRDWRADQLDGHPPEMHQLAIGDTLLAPDSTDAKDPDYILVTRMSRRQGADSGYIILYTYRPLMMNTQRWLCHRMVPFEYGAVIEDVPEARRGKPVRGPYEDTITEARYMFEVHPTGKGRWGADVPVFEFKESGEHRSRPPLMTTRFRNDWERIRFIGESNANRHPNDPVVVAIRKSQVYRNRTGD